MSKWELESLRQNIALRLEKMESMFTKEMRLTFVARHPDNPECIVIVSSDDLTEMMRDVKAQLEKEKA